MRVSIEVVAYDPSWPTRFDEVAATLTDALAAGPAARVEHVGSTSVPGLAAKPVLDIDVIVAPQDVPAAVVALERIGYRHRGDLGVAGREAFHAPDRDPRRTSTSAPRARSTYATISPSATSCASATTSGTSTPL